MERMESGGMEGDGKDEGRMEELEGIERMEPGGMEGMEGDGVKRDGRDGWGWSQGEQRGWGWRGWGE